ncbi:MAG: hypothetical protein ABEJ72_08765, partial [Candidatus Aenigmatarchaeota archaeon]
TYEYMLGSSKKRTEFLKSLGYRNYREIFENLDVPEKAQYDKYEIIKEKVEDLKEKMRKYFDIGRGEDYTERQLTKRCKGVLKQLVSFRTENYFKEDLDRFEDFLEEKIDELNRYKKNRFPVGDIDPDSIDNRDLILLEDST